MASTGAGADGAVRVGRGRQRSPTPIRVGSATFHDARDEVTVLLTGQPQPIIVSLDNGLDTTRKRRTKAVICPKGGRGGKLQ